MRSAAIDSQAATRLRADEMIDLDFHLELVLVSLRGLYSLTGSPKPSAAWLHSIRPLIGQACCICLALSEIENGRLAGHAIKLSDAIASLSPPGQSRDLNSAIWKRIKAAHVALVDGAASQVGDG